MGGWGTGKRVEYKSAFHVGYAIMSKIFDVCFKNMMCGKIIVFDCMNSQAQCLEREMHACEHSSILRHCLCHPWVCLLIYLLIYLFLDKILKGSLGFHSPSSWCLLAIFICIFRGRHLWFLCKATVKVFSG